MKSLILVALLLPAAAFGQEAPADVAAEVDKGVKAYNAQDIKYYESALSPDAVYIAEDGAIIAGKDRVVRLFTRIFARTPKREVAVSDVVTGGKGPVAWARFKWTLTAGPDTRKGVGTTLLVRSGEAWQVVQIQNTPDGHAMPAATGKH